MIPAKGAAQQSAIPRARRFASLFRARRSWRITHSTIQAMQTNRDPIAAAFVRELNGEADNALFEPPCVK